MVPQLPTRMPSRLTAGMPVALLSTQAMEQFPRDAQNSVPISYSAWLLLSHPQPSAPTVEQSPYDIGNCSPHGNKRSAAQVSGEEQGALAMTRHTKEKKLFPTK